MNYNYLIKNTIIYLLITIFIVIILVKIYYLKSTIREGKKCCKIPKPKMPKIPNPKDLVNDAIDAGEDIGKQALEEAARLTEQLNFANALEELVKPLQKLVSTANNTLKSLKDF